jgi:hypothetical protein
LKKKEAKVEMVMWGDDDDAPEYMYSDDLSEYQLSSRKNDEARFEVSQQSDHTTRHSHDGAGQHLEEGSGKESH